MIPLLLLYISTFGESSLIGESLQQQKTFHQWQNNLPVLSERDNTASNDVKKNTGKRCVQKVVMEERWEYDQEIECDHKYDRRCYRSTTTVYETVQEEECTENFVKSCFIENQRGAENVTVNVCRKPLIQDCSEQGKEIECSTQYETECETKHHKHEVVDDKANCETIQEEKCEEVAKGYTTELKCEKWPRTVCDIQQEKVNKTNPVTNCKKVPIKLCGPRGCPFLEGDEVCHPKTKTVVFDKPVETCKLDPRKNCQYVTKLVPQLKEVETCSDVPYEVCRRVNKIPRKVDHPVVKIWCYTYKCPQHCAEAAKLGECLPECEEYADSPDCCPKRTCPQTCLAAAASGICNPTVCDAYSDLPGCKCEEKCPAKCLESVETGECLPECQQFEHLPNCKCVRKCPAECAPYISKGECHKLPTKCHQFSDLPDCQCAQQCPSECRSAMLESDSCKLFNALNCQYFSELSACSCEPPISDSQATCSKECSEAATWGECPSQCREHEGNPACCAPECPAKCTNKRQTECSSEGVEECKGIPGCCPERFDAVFGSGAVFG